MTPRRFLSPLLGLAAAYVVLLLAGLLVTGVPEIGALELRWGVRLASWTVPFAGDAAVLNDGLFAGHSPPYLAMGLVLLGTLLQRPWSAAAVAQAWAIAFGRAAALVIVPWALAHSVKSIVGRTRPDLFAFAHDGLLPQPTNGSFPSGHTAIAAALSLMLVLCLPVAWRPVSLALAAVVVAWTAWSRMVLGMHFFSDTLCSALFVAVAAGCLDRLLPRVRPAGENTASEPAGATTVE